MSKRSDYDELARAIVAEAQAGGLSEVAVRERREWSASPDCSCLLFLVALAALALVLVLAVRVLL